VATTLTNDSAEAVEIGFPFTFYDQEHSICYLSTNGLITFGQANTSNTATTFPSGTSGSAKIAPFWTDLDNPVAYGGKVYYKTIGQAPRRIFIAQYENLSQRFVPGNRVTFQVKLFEGNNAIEIHYKSRALISGEIEPLISIGIENSTGDSGLTYQLTQWVGLNTQLKAFPFAVRFERPIFAEVESNFVGPDGVTRSIALAGKLTPYSGRLPVQYNSVQRFEAPEFVYLNKNLKELDQVGGLGGTLESISLSSGGAYTSTPTVTITGGGGVGATATATLSPSARVTAVGVPNGGSGYSSAPSVTFTGGGGSGVSGTATVENGAVTGVTISNPGTGYTSAPTVAFTGGGGSGAAGTAFIGKSVTSITINSPGNSYTSPPSIVFAEGGGSGATATATLSSSNEDDIAYYRARNMGYAIDGETVQGVDRFFERTLTEDIKVIWKWQLEYAVFIESATTGGITLPDPGNGVGNPLPVVGRIFVPKDTEFSASVDRTVGNDTLGLDISGRRFSADSYQLEDATGVKPVVQLGDTGNRVVTETVTINNWLRVKWRWMGQVRYRFDAAGDSSVGTAPFAGKSFLRVYNKAGNAIEETVTGFAPFNEHWVDLDRKVEVGAFYRSVDNCYTLGNFVNSPSGNLGSVGTNIALFQDALIPDPLAGGTSRAARVWTVNSANAPTEAHFFYEPTTFRAIVPLGKSLDAQNPVLIPTLCTGGALRLGDTGPSDAFTRIGPNLPDGDATGFPVRWDRVGKQLFPVHPGNYQLLWPDAVNPGTSYRIEIVTGYPGETVTLSSAEELPNGMRVGTAPNYNRNITLGSVALTSGFPAAPAAHYRHIYDTNPDRNPPTKLDLSGTDNWKFRELTYRDLTSGATATASASGVPFSASGDGKSVVLFSYRPNLGEIADGTASKEKLAVFVVQSTQLESITPDDPKLILGRRGLALDGSNLGIVQSTPAGLGTINPGKDLVVDFWMNAKGVRPSDAPTTILSTGNDALRVVLNPSTSTITTKYFGMDVTHPFTTAGGTWKHYVVHAFEDSFLGVPVTVVDFYIDGKRVEQGTVGSGTAPGSSVGTTLAANSFRLGLDASPSSGLQVDKLRMFDLPPLFELTGGVEPWLTPSELQDLRIKPNASLRMAAPLIHFNFEPTNIGGAFVNLNTTTRGQIGTGTVNSPVLARLDIQEVATKLDSTLDNAGFGGSGYVLNAVSNYNANLYNRAAEVGTWGPIFPVNHSQLYDTNARRLEVAYYESPYLIDPVIHPNVAWPYQAAVYDEVIYPNYGPNKDKAIYIASRIGSEGVDITGRPQKVFDLAGYANFAIYNQPNNALPGFNPNEEHALAAASNRAGLKVKSLGGDIPNNPPLAAFALQNDANAASQSYTSDPWVLVQVNNLVTGEPEMAAYQVFKTRGGAIPFPRPADSDVNATDGLAYEDAAVQENRFLTIDANKTYSFSYQFDYPVFAGDLLIPPYPLNLVVGNVKMPDDRGGNVQVNGVTQRTLWRDVNHNAWVVSGGGRFFHQFFYPFRADFYLPGSVAAGTPIAWLPQGGTQFTGDNASGDPIVDDNPKPVKITYNSAWRSDYPKLKRGETMTYQGGEYFNETPGANGLPALVAMAATEVVYDSVTPDMIITDSNVGSYSARIIRPLDRREAPFTVAQMGAAEFTPAASEKVFLVAERWYFKQLPGSLQRRFYFDSLAEKLVFRGYLNDKDSGDPDLTAGPDPINILEPNIMTPDEFTLIRNLSGSASWRSVVDGIYKKSLNPDPVRRLVGGTPTEINTSGLFLPGVRELPEVTLNNTGLTNTERTLLTAQRDTFREIDLPWVLQPSGDYAPATGSTAGQFVHLNSLGVGSALVPSPELLRQSVNGSLFVTIAENNRGELSGAPVSLHIIEIIPDRYRGAIKVIEPADAFSEKITLQHNGEFGTNTGDLYYEWWIRDAAPLGIINSTTDPEIRDDGTLKEFDSSGNSLWQQYIPQERLALADVNARHLGLHSIVFEGRPDVVLADKLILMRYRHRNESGWNLVSFDSTNPSVDWQPGSPAPFQWAGAANSPQGQADGSKSYIPQLVMGWVKRVLDRINPYEARYTDFFSNESPATYSSQIQIAGAPYAGKVALNSDKSVIERTGLIELYETVLQRARELSIDNSSNPVSTDGINQALLLAATRLSVLYELLAREAYSDAQDSTIRVTNEDGLSSVASFTHAFQNMEADLLHEEMALLRGTDFKKSYPVDNRIFWNYAKGLGEAAYNVNYNIYDENSDGFINEDDARALYPQGHGDAWGHYLSAIGMHYELLQQPAFNWRSRSEFYSLMQNVLEVDFLDEKTFAKLAAGKARTGRDIVRGTYRLNYTQNPDGQWQGYTDGANLARAWGVSEWAHRAGQGAYFDWAVANAILPEKADQNPSTPLNDPENLDIIERSAAESEIGEIIGSFYEIQMAMDEANGGSNPLGFDSDAIAFDIDPNFVQVSSSIQGKTHFEQIYDRAVTAGTNALSTLDFAAKTENKLRRIADDTDELAAQAFRQDLDYRNRLIEIFGRPYDGTIGFGKLYPEGYEGPDVYLYSYLDRTTIDQIIPTGESEAGTTHDVEFEDIKATISGLASNPKLLNIYSDTAFSLNPLLNPLLDIFGGGVSFGSPRLTEAIQTFVEGNDYQDPTVNFSMPVRRASAYAFQSIPEWGQRTSYGKAQLALEEMLREEIKLQAAIEDHQGFLQDYQSISLRLLNEINLIDEREDIGDSITGVRASVNTAIVAAETAIGIANILSDVIGATADSVAEGLPTSVGFSNDVTSIGRGVALGIAAAAEAANDTATEIKDIAKTIAEHTRDEVIDALERKKVRTEYVSEIEGLLVELEQISGNDGLAAVGEHLQNLEIYRQQYITAISEGFRVLKEREAFNKILASKVQKNRYQDMLFRLSRNEAMATYQSAFNHAAQYTWLAAKAYDYETSLDSGNPAAATQLMDDIVKTRQLGLWSNGQPQSGQGGLAGILSSLNGNFAVLKGQLGINNLQVENENISLRSELFRIGPGLAQGGTSASDTRWQNALKARNVEDLWQLPEFKTHFRPFANQVVGKKEPGLVIRFSSSIDPGKNFFGRPLMASDHAYSSSSFSTKIASAGILLDGYDTGTLASTPRAYLIPVGVDSLRVSTATQPLTRTWSVHDTRIPTPFTINQTQLTSPGFIPSLDGIDGRFQEPRRHADFRVYYGNTSALGSSTQSTRLIGRSIWNSEWLLVIPGANLNADSTYALQRLTETISDIKLTFKTYSHSGQ